MLSASAFLLLLGIILYVGVVGSYIYQRYGIPDVLNLIVIGLLLGPVFHLVRPDVLTPWMPLVGAIALSLILFEGGLDLDFQHILERFGLSFLLASGSFWLSAGLIAVLYRFLVGAPWIPCLLLGTTLGCVSSAVILPIANRLHAPDHVRATINLEAAVSDMWGAVVTLVLIRLAPIQIIDPGQTINAVIGAFTSAVLFAGAVGMLWLWALDRLRESPFAYMMTLAAVFLIYGFVELLHGSGPMAALGFGIVLTNADQIAKLFGKKFKFILDEKIRWFNTEVTFFARTFFFVYLGLVVSLRSFNLGFFLTAAIIFFSVILSRYLAVKLAGPALRQDGKDYSKIYMAMLPRGLTSAVLVGMVQAADIPGTESFLEYAFLTILLTNALMTWEVYQYEHGMSLESPGSLPPPGKQSLSSKA